jgi:glycosyltransferase involved in cell wall biosynthesis
MTLARRLVFYRTLAIDEEARSGSAVRPAKLLQAFRRLGYEVDVVAGPAASRRHAIAQVKRNLQAGVHYEFMYAEPPTTPVLLNERHHMPIHPLLDYLFFRYTHSRGVPCVLFYSDVQWRLPQYWRRIGFHKYLFMLPFFHLDLAVYAREVDALLVPDRGMLSQIPGLGASKRAWVSLPGFDPDEQPLPRVGGEGSLRLFYVGGIERPVYDLVPLLDGVAQATTRGLAVQLTICCREPEWRRRPADYDRFLGPQVRIVHNRTRRELLELYAANDVAVMPYGTLNSDWAMPIKFAEAIGMETPVIAGAGTAVGRTVTEQGIGWVVGTAADELRQAIARIDRPELERVRANVLKARPSYSWTSRAEEIAAIAEEVRPATSRDPVGMSERAC